MPQNEKNKNGWGVLAAAVITVFVLWGLNWILLWFYVGESDKRGQFGDMFGSVNALFSGLAFAFLIYTIWLQREELTLQREELTMQRKALELQAEELKRQADELEKAGILQRESLEIQRLQMKMAEEQSAEARNRLELQNKPNFTSNGRLIGSYTSDSAKFELVLINVGGPASNVKVGNSPNLKQSGEEYSYIEKDKKLILNWVIKDVPNFPEEVDFELTFDDLFGTMHRQSFKMLNDKTKISESNKFKVIPNQ